GRLDMGVAVGVEHHRQAVVLLEQLAQAVGIVDVQLPRLTGQLTVVGELPGLVVAVQRRQVHHVLGADGRMGRGDRPEGVRGPRSSAGTRTMDSAPTAPALSAIARTVVPVCGQPSSLCSPPQPVPAPTRKPCSSTTDCSCLASWGKYPQGPVSITEKPASAISASAVRQWICFSSSGNHTPHWSGQTPMVSLSNGGSGLRDLSMRVVEASVVVMTLLLRRSSEVGRAGSVVSREAHGALDGLVLGGPAGGDGLLLGVEADALGA